MQLVNAADISNNIATSECMQQSRKPLAPKSCASMCSGIRRLNQLQQPAMQRSHYDLANT
jgi:hypothetical protein